LGSKADSERTSASASFGTPPESVDQSKEEPAAGSPAPRPETEITDEDIPF
jgi:hypothetical protein